jgi:hypothetical protein
MPETRPRVHEGLLANEGLYCELSVGQFKKELLGPAP